MKLKFLLFSFISIIILYILALYNAYLFVFGMIAYVIGFLNYICFKLCDIQKELKLLNDPTGEKQKTTDEENKKYSFPYYQLNNITENKN